MNTIYNARTRSDSGRRQNDGGRGNACETQQFNRCGALLPFILLGFLLTAPDLPARPAAEWQPSVSTNANAQTTQELASKVQASLTETRAELGRWLSARELSTNLPAGATPAEAIAYESSLGSAVRMQEQHLAELSRLETVRKAQAELEASISAWKGFPEPPPYSILRVDALRNSIQSLKSKIEAGKTAREVLVNFMGEGETASRRSDEQMRRIVEEMETTKDAARLQTLQWQRTLERARNALLGAQASLNRTRGQRLQSEVSQQKEQLAFLERQLASTEGHVTFSATDLATVTEGLDREAKSLEAEKLAAEQENTGRKQELASARAELAKALLRAADGGTVTNGDVTVQALQRRIELCNVQAETAAQRLGTCLQLLEMVSNQKGLWQARYSTYSTTDLRRLQQAYRNLERLSQYIKAARPHFQQQVELAAALGGEQQERLRDLPAPGTDPAAAPQLLESYQEREEWARRALAGLDHLDRLAGRWRDELDQQRNAMPLTDRVRDLFAGAAGFATRLWNFELFTVQDTITVDDQSITGQRRVTVGKISTAALIVVIGYWISLVLSRLFERFAISRLKLHPNQAGLVRRWVRIFLLIILVVFSLVSVKIPLTVFAFMGGALAIGVGFGTQTLLKNFISGIIILVERTFRVGDVLDVGDRRGTITNIGIRASVLQLWDGTEVLIPNSALLENHVINWTYSNKVVRFSVEVGVAYGSDARRVTKLLAEIADQHGLVQKEPQPQVLLQRFGDNAIEFEMRYWVDVLGTNPAQVASDLRHMILTSFSQNGIVIAFPQRDVHLDVANPLPVKVVETDKSGRDRVEPEPVMDRTAGAGGLGK